MEEKQFASLLDRLDKIIKLQALTLLKGIEKELEKVTLLDTLEFKPSEIDKVLSKSPGYASVVLSQVRKKETKASTEKVRGPNSSLGVKNNEQQPRTN